jgi:hypothetical protein
MIFPELARLMAYKRMFIKDLAKVIGCSTQATSKKLKGEAEFKRSEMQKIKEYFSDIFPELTMDEIFKENIFLPM